MNNHWTFFAFPLNLLLALLWAIVLVWLWKKYPQSKVVRFLLSPAATISALSLLLVSCLWQGLRCDAGFSESIPFLIILLYVQTVLLLVTLRGWRTPAGVIRWRFLLLHAGLLLAVGSGFWGAPDSDEFRVALKPGQETVTVFREDGSSYCLGYFLGLADCDPVKCEASIMIWGSKPIKISVNSPHSVRLGEDVYIASVSETHCILQIVKEPWRYFCLVGVVMLLSGAFLLFIKGPRR